MLQPWERKAEEMVVIQSVVDDGENVYFNYVEMPSETEPGSFRVLLRPNCGADLAGCFIEMNFNYTSVHSAIDIEYEVLPDTAVGLDNDQIERLQYEVIKAKELGCTNMEMIDVIQDFLGQENPESRLVYRAAQQQQQAEEQEKVQKKKKDALDYKRKQANRLRMDY